MIKKFFVALTLVLLLIAASSLFTPSRTSAAPKAMYDCDELRACAQESGDMSYSMCMHDHPNWNGVCFTGAQAAYTQALSDMNDATGMHCRGDYSQQGNAKCAH